MHLFTGCGKNESACGAFGTASGAAIGATVTGKKDKATGAVIGGLVGNLLGREVGKSSDRKEEHEKRLKKQQEELQQKRKISSLKEENRQLKSTLDKWCADCGKKVTLIGAQNCPKCSGTLIRYRYCRECGNKFEVQTGYKFCPYCPKVRLNNKI